MTILLECLLSLVIAAVLSVLFGLARGREFRSAGFYLLFLIIFLSTLAGGYWLRPFGPYMWGIPWMPFLVSGLIVTLILSLSIPTRPPSNRHETVHMLERIKKERDIEQFTYVSLSALFWLLLFILIIAIIARFFSL